MGRVGRGWSPTKRGVAGYKDCRDGIGIEIGKRAANGFTGFEFIVAGNFNRGEDIGHRNGAVEIVGVRRAQTGYRGVGLSPRGSVFRVRMRDASNVRELPIEFKVSRQIGGRA